MLEARLDFGFCDYASPDVLTFEFRLTRVGETVAGPRGLWWDELLRLFVERLEFETEPGAIHRPELTMKLDAISAATLWGSSIEA